MANHTSRHLQLCPAALVLTLHPLCLLIVSQMLESLSTRLSGKPHPLKWKGNMCKWQPLSVLIFLNKSCIWLCVQISTHTELYLWFPLWIFSIFTKDTVRAGMFKVALTRSWNKSTTILTQLKHNTFEMEWARAQWTGMCDVSSAATGGR